ncbi:MAG: HAMP domain-containing histidine kinase [Actinomycetia bacterium]|nr:HAMP domain-containing histidine kinase [Actinomycetes bacterium]
MTLRNRVAAAAALGVLIVVAAVSAVLYFTYAASLRSRVDGSLVAAAQQASTILQNVKQTVSSGKGPAPNLDKPITVGSIELQLFTGAPSVGQPTSFGPFNDRDVAVARNSQAPYFMDASSGGRRSRVYTAPLPGMSDGGLVRASRALDADDGALRTAALLLAGLTAAATAATYGALRLTAGRVLRPIGELTAAAEHVTRTQDLAARIAATKSADEVSRLGASFNAMLAALDESLTAQQRLVADASHELRTPLTSITTNLDLLEDGAGVADPQAPELVRAAREQAGELDQLITDLLDLARHQEAAPHLETVRLDLLAEQVLRRTRQRAPQAVIAADLAPCLARADPGAVDHAIANLLDNAIKWTPPGGPVEVTVANHQVSVTDHGPGIPDEDLPHIFERFYRASSARGLPGAGLGLAIVARIAKANEATVAVRTGPAGSTFTLAFPEPAPEGTPDAP